MKFRGIHAKNHSFHPAQRDRLDGRRPLEDLMKFRPEASGVNFEEISHITDGQILVLCVGQDPFLKLLTITYQRNHTTG